MTQLPVIVPLVARGQHGLITGAQLGDAGISPYRRRRLLEAGVIVGVHDNVYRFNVFPPSFEQRCLAACLAEPDLAISGPTAGRLLKVRRMPAGPIHAMIHRRSVQLDGVIIHRTNLLDRDDVVSRQDGIRLLSCERLTFDLARFLDDDDIESVIEQLLDRRMVTIPTLFATARRLKRMGRDGSARFGRVLGRRPTWSKPQDSDLEVRLLRALRERGVHLEPQFEVELPDGAVIHLDGGHRASRFGVEVDHVTWHGGRASSDYDKWRTRQLLRIGWVVPRVPDSEIEANVDGVARELVEIYLSRAIA